MGFTHAFQNSREIFECGLHFQCLAVAVTTVEFQRL